MKQPALFHRRPRLLLTAGRNLLQQYVYINNIFIIYYLPCVTFLTVAGKRRDPSRYYLLKAYTFSYIFEQPDTLAHTHTVLV